MSAEEDPATGSAASGLAAYLVLKEAAAKGSQVDLHHDFLFVQGVEMGRRSDIGIRVTLNPNSEGIDSVEISGSSVKVAEGDMRLN